MKGRSAGKEKGITKWKNLQMIASGPELQKTTTLWKGCRCQKQLIILTFKKKKKKTRTKNTYLSLSNDTRSVLLFKISLVKTTVTLAHDYQTATWPIPVSLAIGVAAADRHAGQSEQNE